MNGCERLKNMMEEAFNRPLLKIYSYLKTRTDLYDKYLNEEKSLNEMYEYIKSQAKRQAVKGVAVIEPNVVYAWAVKYFNESNEELGLKKKEIQNSDDNKKTKNVERIKSEDEKATETQVDNDKKTSDNDNLQITMFGGEE